MKDLIKKKDVIEKKNICGKILFEEPNKK